MAYPRSDHNFYVDPRGQKVAWYRDIPGRLRVAGSRLDAKAAPLKADITHGYGLIGFQVSGLVFSSPGCWRVSAHLVSGARTRTYDFYIRVTRA